jgi:hypothetical protein
MDLRPYIDNIHQQLAVAAEAGGEEARALAQRLSAPLDASIRLTLHEVLAMAAEEITTELAPGSVELRLRGRDPEFVVTAPPLPPSVEGTGGGNTERPGSAAWSATPESKPPSFEGDEGSMTRINLRLPEHLKSRVEDAAARQGLSINAWLVRAAATALDRTDNARRSEQRAPRGAQRYTGWSR